MRCRESMIEQGAKYGCLTVLDMGAEYARSEEYLKYEAEYAKMIERIGYYERIADSGTNAEKSAILSKYPQFSFSMQLRENVSCIDDIFKDFVAHKICAINDRIRELKERGLQTHYKCQCKCGRIHYYDSATIESKPRFCIYPSHICKLYYYNIWRFYL